MDTVTPSGTVQSQWKVLYTRSRLYGLRIYGLFGDMVNFLLVPNGIHFHTIKNSGYMVCISVIWSNRKVMNLQNLADITSNLSIFRNPRVSRMQNCQRQRKRWRRSTWGRTRWRWGRSTWGWTQIFAYMVIETPIFGYMVFGNMVIFGFMVNFFPVPRWTIYPGASVYDHFPKRKSIIRHPMGTKWPKSPYLSNPKKPTS